MPTASRKPAETEAEKLADEPTIQPSPEDLKAEKFVQHFPHEGFGARRINREDWASIGIDQGSVEWNEANLFRLPTTLFSEAALKYLDKNDDGFKIVDA